MLRGVERSTSKPSHRGCTKLSPVILQSPTVDCTTGAPHVATYDPSKVVWPDHILGVQHIFDLSVFCDPYIWLWSASLVCFSIAVGVIAGAEDMDSKWILAAHNGVSALGTVVAFVIGGFLTLVVSTWNSRRKEYSSLIGASRNLLIQLSTVVSTAGNAAEPASAAAEVRVDMGAARARSGRYVLLACELAYAKARGKMDADETREALLKGRLLVAGEWEAMAKGDRHTTVYCWIQSIAVTLARRGAISGFELTLVSEAVSSARSQANDLMASLGKDLPYPYASFVIMLVKFHMLAQALDTGIEIYSYGELGPQVLGAAFLMVNLTHLQAILHHHQIMHNPFSDRRIGVAHDTIVTSGLRHLCDTLMSGHAFVPPEDRGGHASESL